MSKRRIDSDDIFTWFREKSLDTAEAIACRVVVIVDQRVKAERPDQVAMVRRGRRPKVNVGAPTTEHGTALDNLLRGDV